MATQTELIRGKIAKILDSREVVLNVGTEQGVEPGMKFEILSQKGLEIPDPDTGVILGSIDFPKGKVRVVNVYNKVSVASTYRTETVNVGGMLGPDVRKLFQPPQWETRLESLKVKRLLEQKPTGLDESDSYVAVGDPVVQVLDAQG